jgi:hypothetical protein
MSDNDDKIAKLEAQIAEQKTELAALKAAQAKPTRITQAESDAWADKMREAEDARFRNFPHSPEMIRGYEAACDRATAHDLASHGTVQGPSGHGVSGRVVGVHPGGGARGVPGGGTGWAREVELSPPPGVAACDRLMDAQDAKDRAALIERERRLKGK